MGLNLIKNYMNLVQKIVNNLVSPIDSEAGALSNIPNFVIAFSIFMSGNAILQAITDVILEVVILLKLVSFKIPFRLEFLLLTVISTVIAYLTLKGMREGNLDLTKNTLLLGLLVESSLVIGDIYLLANTQTDFVTIFLVRLPFLFLTTCNILIISFILWRRHQTKKARPHYKF